MRKSKSDWRFIIGLLPTQQEYTVGGVKYIVESKFQREKSKPTIADCMERCVTSDFIQLTVRHTADKISSEYVCSAAGEEDHHAVE